MPAPCSLSPNGFHHWRIESEQTTKKASRITGTWTGICLWCMEEGGGKIDVPQRLPKEDRKAKKQQDEEAAYRRWLAESEEGSFCDQP